MPNDLRCIRILKGRGAETVDEWKHRGFDFDQVQPLLTILQRGMDYPNNRFLPDDLFTMFVNDDSYDFSTLEIAEEIMRVCPKCDLFSLNIGDTTTIGEFVSAVIALNG